MTLQEILYGSWMPPEQTQTRRNKLGITGGARYQSPSKREKNECGLGKTEVKVYDELKRHTKFISATTLAYLLGITRTNCSIVLTALHKKGLTNRSKIEEGSVRYYVYMTKETT